MVLISISSKFQSFDSNSVNAAAHEFPRNDNRHVLIEVIP